MLLRMRELLRRRVGIDVRRVRRLGPDKVERFSNFREEEIIEDQLGRIGVTNAFCVDIGAGDGRTASNSYALFRAGWRGVAFEVDGMAFSDLATTLAASRGVTLVRSRVTPDNVCRLLAASDAPRDPDVLSIDIDGYDHWVLERVLGEYRPRLVCAEINEKIPPPVLFSVLYSDDYSWGENHFYGQSIAMLELLAGAHGYALVGLEYNNAFLMPAELASDRLTAAEAYQSGYVARPDRLRRLPWNRDMEPLLHMSPDDCVREVRRRFAQHAGRFVCALDSESLELPPGDSGRARQA